jgi:hypothetical protein
MAVNIKTIVDAFLTRVNHQDFNIAEDINNLQAALKELAYATLAQGEFANTQTMSANKTLTNDDSVMQFLNPNTDNRDVILPAVGATNHPFLIVNTNGGSYTLTVKTAGGSEVATLLPGKNSFFVSNGAQWIVLADGAEGGGGGGLTNSIAAVTTGNVTGVPGTRHILDVSGMTANRYFVLPAGMAEDEIELVISTEDDTYCLIVKGDTGITINGGSAATEWDRTQAKNDRVRFVATSSTNWQTIGEFESRKTLPSFEARQSTPHSVNNTTNTAIICNIEDKDTDGYYNTANGRFTPLVAGTYEFHGTAAIVNIADAKEVWMGFRKNGTIVRWVGIANSSFANADPGAGGSQRFYLDGVDDYVEMIIWHNHGSALNTYDGGDDNICHFGGHRVSPFDICGV